MNRTEFFDRIRSATRAGCAYRVHLDKEDRAARVGYVGAGLDIVGELAAKITLAGGTATVVNGIDEARRAVATLLDQYAPQSAICWQHALLDELLLDELLADRGISSCDYSSLAALPANEYRQRMMAADIGITSVMYAVAETGTLAVAARPGQERVASLLPPVHIAIVEREQIVPDLFDLFDALSRLGADHLPSNVALITGPSKTGDIELRLTTGVHGPGVWQVILLSE